MGFFDQGGQQYDPNDPNKFASEFEAVPAGNYEADITQAELKDGRKRGSQYVNLRHDIVGPSYQGRVLFGRITVSNPNSQAEKIGRKQLYQLQGATGVHAIRTPQDLQQFVGKRVTITVSCEREEDPAQQQYADKRGMKNNVKAWKAIAGSQMPQVQPSVTPQQPQQPNTAPAANGTQSKAPW